MPSIAKGQRFTAKNGKVYEASMDSFVLQTTKYRICKPGYEGIEVVYARPINVKTGIAWQGVHEWKVSECKIPVQA